MYYHRSGTTLITVERSNSFPPMAPFSSGLLTELFLCTEVRSLVS